MWDVEDKKWICIADDIVTTDEVRKEAQRANVATSGCRGCPGCTGQIGRSQIEENVHYPGDSVFPEGTYDFIVPFPIDN